MGLNFCSIWMTIFHTISFTKCCGFEISVTTESCGKGERKAGCVFIWSSSVLEEVQTRQLQRSSALKIYSSLGVLVTLC